MIKSTVDSAIQNDRFRLFATLSRHFNSYFEISRKYLNLVTDSREELVFTSPFVDFNKKSPQEKCAVAVWTVTDKLYRELEAAVSFVETFGERPSKIYIPVDFQESYQTLFNCLGKPEYILEGVLVSSGRSIWVFDADGPFCLKYDSAQLLEKKYFTEAPLSESGIWHSKAVTEILRGESHYFYEDSGLCITLNEKYENKDPLKLTYLIRRPNPGFDFSSSDNLIPLHSFLSPRFWQHEKLLASLGMNKAFESFIPELAKVFADFIAGAVTRTAVHFESHQQNISLQTGGGRLKKIIVQDLQDILFDPVSYLGIKRPKTPADFAKVRDQIFNFQWLLHFNPQGELIKHDSLLRESMAVSSFYRRYISNQAHLNESVAILSGQENFLSLDFELMILENLKKAVPVKGVTEKAAKALAGDLYWYIDRCVFEQHQRIADEYFAMAAETGAPEVNIDVLMGYIQNFNVIGSAGFPVHISKIRKELFGKVYNLFDNSFFLARYDGQTVIIMIFRYVSI